MKEGLERTFMLVTEGIPESEVEERPTCMRGFQP